MQKMHASKTCAIDLHFLIRRGGRHGCRLAVADFHVRWHQLLRARSNDVDDEAREVTIIKIVITTNIISITIAI